VITSPRLDPGVSGRVAALARPPRLVPSWYLVGPSAQLRRGAV